MIEKLLLLLALLCPACAAFAATYVYQGTNYTAATAGSAYTTAMKPSGSFTTAAPLPSNLAGQDLGPHGLNLVTDWSFSDGVNTYSPATSNLYNFEAYTDAGGNIFNFEMTLASPRAPLVVNERIDVLALTSAAAQAYIGDPCTAIDTGGFCSSAVPDGETTQAQNVSSAQFALSAPQSTSSAPIGSPMMLSALALLLTLTAGWLQRFDPRCPD